MRILVGVMVTSLLAVGLWAQQIPSGTLLPAMLSDTLDSKRTKPGDQISAKLMQDAPLPDGSKVKRGSKVFGHVVGVLPASSSSGARIVVQFDHIAIDKKDVPVTTSLRALASMRAVSTAQQPVNANSGNGTSVWDWNMVQVGGQAVFNGQRIVKSQKGEVVGRVPEPGAVLAVPLPNPARGCDSVAGSTSEQAFWVFSTNACGVYGYRYLSLEREPGGARSGQVTLQSSKSIVVRGGSGWLLRVNTSQGSSGAR